MLHEYSTCIGESTNNVAEYTALTAGFDLALMYKPKLVRFFSDSEVVIRQLTGEYDVKALHLKMRYADVKEREKKVWHACYCHVPRTHKIIQLADAMVKNVYQGVSLNTCHTTSATPTEA